MIQNLIYLLTGAVAGTGLTLLGKPIRAICVASRARGVDPETKAMFLTKAFEIDPWNCRIAHDLAEAHLALARRNKPEKAIHFEAAAKALSFADSKCCRWWSTNESLRQSASDLRRNVNAKLAGLR